MVVRNQDYWKERLLKIESLQFDKKVKFDKELRDGYINAINQIEKDLDRWYKRFAVSEGVTLDEARKRLNSKELRDFHIDVKQYIKLAKKNGNDPRIMRILESASSRVHISRLESLFVQLEYHISNLYLEQSEGIETLLEDVYLEQYNRVAYTVQTGTNTAFALAAIPEDSLKVIILKPWSPDGINFSERIYRDREELVNVLQTELTRAFSLGEGVDKTARRIRDRLDITFRQAVRLVQTEETAIASRANQNAFKELSVDKYQYIATLDSRTSDICQTFDLRVFEISQYEVGTTAPPLHVNCRSTTAPYLEGIDYAERIARDKDGKNVYVPGNLSYKKWLEEYGVKKINSEVK